MGEIGCREGVPEETRGSRLRTFTAENAERFGRKALDHRGHRGTRRKGWDSRGRLSLRETRSGHFKFAGEAVFDHAEWSLQFVGEVVLDHVEEVVAVDGAGDAVGLVGVGHEAELLAGADEAFDHLNAVFEVDVIVG